MAEIKRTLSTNGAARFDVIDAEVAEEGMHEDALEKAIIEWKNSESGEDFAILWLPVRCESVCCDAWGAPDWVAVPIGASRAWWLHRESGRMKANGLLYAASAWAVEASGNESRTPDVRLVFDDEYLWMEGHVGDGPEFQTEPYALEDLFEILDIDEDDGTPDAYVVVHGGVAEAVSRPGVEIEVVDFDNFDEEESKSAHERIEAFRAGGLA